jgi:hypothetical protein
MDCPCSSDWGIRKYRPYRLLVDKYNEKLPLGRPRRR